jgi:hypothetical protein
MYDNQAILNLRIKDLLSDKVNAVPI